MPAPASNRRVRCGLAWLAAACVAAALAGCGVQPKRQATAVRQPESVAAIVPSPSVGDSVAARPLNPPRDTGKIAEIYPGTGRTADLAGARRPEPAQRGDITLNFVGADLREVAQVVLRDLLGVNYTIDADVRGTVTLEFAQAVAREDLLPILEVALEASGAALLRAPGVYRIASAATAGRRAGLSAVGPAGTGEAGFTVAVYPLRFIGAEEIKKVVEPLVGEGRLVRADAARALLIVAGNSREQRLVGQTVQLFDVDQLAGTSVLLESLEHVDVGTLAFELDNVFGGLDKGPLAGQVRLVPIERMNAILVFAKQPRYLEEARSWIARLDRTRNAKVRRLFVYYAQNGKAGDLAKTLRGVFQPGTEDRTPVAGVELSPALAQQSALGQPGQGLPPPPPQGAPQPASRPAAGANNSGAESVRIIADEKNNAVLVLASPEEYVLIEEVLSKLDIQPLQVMIEANIFEVTLRDQLRFGLQYFIKSGGFNITRDGSAVLSSVATGLLQPSFPGFAFTLADADQARFILDTLSQLTEVNVVSSPQVMVLDNQSAKLRVGDQVPIITQFSTSTFTADARTVNTVEYRDTGVTLEVTPRVNASGLVTLEIGQEVSDVVPTTTSTINSPTIQQRKIVSTVAVHGGETVVLGGLIRESNTDTKSSLPVLGDLPVIGVLFGNQAADLRRTELLVMLRPVVVRSQREARDLSAEIRRRYQAILEQEESGLRQPRRFAPPGSGLLGRGLFE